jgi:MerR family transcriptional regulator/heat shock protein HspR
VSEEDRPVYVISVAARLAALHPQTLRQYDRLGIVVPNRTAGRGRRYSLRDIEALRQVQALSQMGVNLEGIRRVLELQSENRVLRREVQRLRAELERRARVFKVGPEGDAVPVPPGRRHRHAAEADAAGQAEGGTAADEAASGAEGPASAAPGNTKTAPAKAAAAKPKAEPAGQVSRQTVVGPGFRGTVVVWRP